MNTNKKYRNDWSDYWQSGLSTSCISNNGNNEYPDAIKSFWLDNFLPLIATKTTMLDLCSGGGGVPRLLMNSINNKKFELQFISTDYADISFKEIVKEKLSISFISNCQCDNLAFANNSLDYLTSCYGIEYSNIKETLIEVDRVLRPNGLFAAVIHSENSELIVNSKAQLDQGNYILNHLLYFDFFRKFYLSKRRSKAFHNKAEKKLKDCLNKIKLKMLTQENNFVLKRVLGASHDIYLFAQTNPITQVINLINKSEKSLQQNYNRLENLLSITNDELNINSTIRFFQKSGYKVIRNSTVSDNNKTVGFGLICQKSL